MIQRWFRPEGDGFIVDPRIRNLVRLGRLNLLDGPGNMTADQMEAAWMASPPHRANIMNGAFTQVGVGIAFASDGRVWVCVDFGG